MGTKFLVGNARLMQETVEGVLRPVAGGCARRRGRKSTKAECG